MVSTGSLGIDVTTSLTELFWGFLIGTALGLATGFALARSAALGAFLDPIVESFRFILPLSSARYSSSRTPAISWSPSIRPRPSPASIR
jgi:ABC-type nitrate/sulfonate/bicarbonate transport system permease component